MTAELFKCRLVRRRVGGGNFKGGGGGGGGGKKCLSTCFWHVASLTTYLKKDLVESL